MDRDRLDRPRREAAAAAHRAAAAANGTAGLSPVEREAAGLDSGGYVPPDGGDDDGPGGAAAAAAGKGKEGRKKGLPWKLYRRAQKEERRAARRSEGGARRAEAREAAEAARLGLPESPLVAPQWGGSAVIRETRDGLGFPRLPAANNPRRAARAARALLAPPRAPGPRRLK